MSQQPQISPDGRFYWDGQRWVPMPTQQQKQGIRARMGMTGALNSCVGYGCIIVAILFAIAAASAVCSGGK